MKIKLLTAQDQQYTIIPYLIKLKIQPCPTFYYLVLVEGQEWASRYLHNFIELCRAQ